MPTMSSSVGSTSFLSLALVLCFAIGADAFVPVHSPASKTSASSSLCAENKLTLIDDPDVVAKPVAFRLADSEKKTAGEESVIECYVDAIAKINDVDYSVGFPVDHAVDIAVIEEDEDGEEGLTLLETDDPLMDKLFAIAKDMIEQDDSKLALYRTPATITLAGNLGMDDDEDDEDEDEDEDGVEAADLLLSFEYEGQEYNLVKPTDLMLLVGKEDVGKTEQRVLITDEESEELMPTLVEMLGL